MRIGVLGGTFDPVHSAHVAIARAVLDRLQLDAVRLVPCHRPPHKDRDDLTPGAHRLAMIALATQNEPALVPNAAELERPAPSYTIDTMREFAGAQPDEEFYFIMGMDSFREIGTWKEHESLLREHHLVVVDRPDQADKPSDDEVPTAAHGRVVDGAADLDTAEGRIHLLEITPRDVSATEVRRRAARNEDLGDLVPVPVATYIRKCCLYRT